MVSNRALRCGNNSKTRFFDSRSRFFLVPKRISNERMRPNDPTERQKLDRQALIHIKQIWYWVIKARLACLRLFLNWAQAWIVCCETCSSVSTLHSESSKTQRGLTANTSRVLSDRSWILSGSVSGHFALLKLLRALEAPIILSVRQGKCTCVFVLAFSRGYGKMSALRQSNYIVNRNGPVHLKRILGVYTQSSATTVR